MRLLYFCEGFTDIRFVTGLAEIAELRMVIPAWEFQSSGLADRIADSGARLKVDVIQGRRPAYQLRSFLYLLRRIRNHDIVLSQDMVRGSLNTTIVGRLRGVPVVTLLGIDPVAYYRCRRERGRIGWLEAAAGEAFIRFAMAITGRLSTVALGMGPYLRDVAGRTAPRTGTSGYYGVDTCLFSPTTPEQRTQLRRQYDLPQGHFILLFSSRMSHEKDPETVLRATAKVRASGLNAVVLNLGGGYRDFLRLAHELGFTDAEDWVIGRPAVHPMKNLYEYFQLADAVVQSSLEEGFGLAPLEALSCGTPVIATQVGGMRLTLAGIAQLTPRRDEDAMARAIQWVAQHPSDARAQALKGRAYVEANWDRRKVFADLRLLLEQAYARPA
ncbi:MAG TPA: glycosyltransferase family 4 protein [Vicinamibacterales bacterium]|nr:glycosyltransferase family 4 protein [Vicinamibacterales bacterium]